MQILSEEQRKREERRMSLLLGAAVGVLAAYVTAYALSLSPGDFLSGLGKAIQRISSMHLLFVPTLRALWSIPAGAGVMGAVYFFLDVDSQKRGHFQDNAIAGTGGFMTIPERRAYQERYITPDPEPISDHLPVPYDPDRDAGKYSQNLIMSQNFARPINSRTILGNNNVLVVGGAGTGKSRYLVKPNLLQMNASYIITDPSGELIRSLGSVMQRHGYRIKVFNLSDMNHSNCYNPFAYIRDEAGVNMLIECLVRNTSKSQTGGGDNQFFEDAEKLLYAACIYYMREFGQDENVKNFSGVLKMINASNVSEEDPSAKSPLDRLFERLPQDSLAWRHYKAFKQAAGRTLKSIIISCVVRMQPFFTPQVERLTSLDELDLGSLGEVKTALFIITPQADRTYAFLASILYSQAFETLYHKAEQKKQATGDEELKIPVRCIMDEFANIGKVPDFPSRLATMRKYNISAMIVLQDLAQISSMYKEDWKTLVGNCSTLIFLGGQELDTLKYFAQKLGKATIRTRSNSSSQGASGRSSESYQNTGREVMTEEELGRMPPEECIVCTQNMRPVRDKKYDYTKHPYYPQTADADERNAFPYNTMSAYDTRRASRRRGFLRAQAEAARIREGWREAHSTPAPAEQVTLRGDVAHLLDCLSFGEETDGRIYRQKALQAEVTILEQLAQPAWYPMPVATVQGLPPKHLGRLLTQTAHRTGAGRLLILDDISLGKEDGLLLGLATDTAGQDLSPLLTTPHTEKLVRQGGFWGVALRKRDAEDFIREVSANGRAQCTS